MSAKSYLGVITMWRELAGKLPMAEQSCRDTLLDAVNTWEMLPEDARYAKISKPTGSTLTTVLKQVESDSDQKQLEQLSQQLQDAIKARGQRKALQSCLGPPLHIEDDEQRIFDDLMLKVCTVFMSTMHQMPAKSPLSPLCTCVSAHVHLHASQLSKGMTERRLPRGGPRRSLLVGTHLR